nr:MAG TPA: hypothetical protein [Caudoviricetes sp.]
MPKRILEYCPNNFTPPQEFSDYFLFYNLSAFS